MLPKEHVKCAMRTTCFGALFIILFMYQVFPKEHVKSALETVYAYNVLQFREGTMGAVNGMRPNGTVSISESLHMIGFYDPVDFWVIKIKKSP